MNVLPILPLDESITIGQIAIAFLIWGGVMAALVGGIYCLVRMFRNQANDEDSTITDLFSQQRKKDGDVTRARGSGATPRSAKLKGVRRGN